MLAFLLVAEADGMWEFVSDAGRLERGLLPQLGAGASFLAVSFEESGVPLPGDVFVMYLGHLVASSTPLLIATWTGLVFVVVAGSSNSISLRAVGDGA